MCEELTPLSLDAGTEPQVSEKVALSLEYLRALNEEAYLEQARKLNVLTKLDFEPYQDWTADACINCLRTFLEQGIWPGYLFTCGRVWSLYMTSIAEERYHAALEYVCQFGSPADLILYLRAAYKFGQQVIPDQEYDGLEKLYLQVFPQLAYLNDTTNDDVGSMVNSIVNDAIRMSGVRGAKDSSPRSAPQSGSYASLNAEKSTSIRPVRSYEEAYDYLKQAPRVRTHWSLKVDGFNTKCLFKDNGGGLDVSVSRGRAADGWDYTEAISRVIRVQGVDTSQLSGKITGEAMVDPAALEGLRFKYPGKDYKTPKSTAGAMLRAPQQFEDCDYQHLKFYPFDWEGVHKDVAFRDLSRSGFTPPPGFVVEPEQLPLGSLEEFSGWLDRVVLDPLWASGQEMRIGSDGVVLQLLTDIENDRADKYSDLNIALKFSHWTEVNYQSKVVGIEFEQRRVEMSVVLVIEPVTTRDLNVATRVSIGSPAILVGDDVRVGDTIEFARKSEAINVYLRKVVS